MYLDTQNSQRLLNRRDRNNYLVSLLIGGGVEYLLVLQLSLFQVDVYYVSEFLQIALRSEGVRYLLVLGSHEFDIAIALNVDSNPLLAT